MGISSILGLGRGKKATNLANQGFNYLKSNPLVQATQGAGLAGTQGLLGALGLGGDQAASDAAFQNFQNSTGFRSQLDEGQRAITGSAAARGELGSGGTLKRLNRFGQQLGQQSYQSFLAQLQGLSDRGLSAANSVGAAGTAGGTSAASNQPQNTGILGRFFGI